MSTLTIKNITVGEGIPKIIIPLVGANEGQILQEAEYVKSLQPDVVEWRVDLFEQVEDLPSVQKMVSKIREVIGDILLLFTFRSHKEGGNKVISDSFYVLLNQAAIRSEKIDLIDVELFNEAKNIEAIVSLAKKHGVFVIMSNHDFEKTPVKDEIVNRLRKMQEYGADIPKIAVMPTSVADVITLLDATDTMKTQYADRPIITMSMGGTGVISRLAGEVFGSAFTFGAGSAASAPGQIPVKELRDVLEILHKSM
ncbi:type I 3-dehydroquinate dehydratase [Neobacillus sp. LXY-4]|uniref:type I 3-dehydroquinate dehydratase n=1 Tax=Neobacillus sp. LXY-4 TaxID=3379826 RepID=UPI003EDEC2D6